jgi:hypothetical protein
MVHLASRCEAVPVAHQCFHHLLHHP